MRQHLHRHGRALASPGWGWALANRPARRTRHRQGRHRHAGLADPGLGHQPVPIEGARGPALLDVDPELHASSADARVIRETTFVFGMYAEASYCFAGNPLRLRRIQLQPDPADCRAIQSAASAVFPAAHVMVLQSSFSCSAAWTVDSQTIARYSAAAHPSRLVFNELASDRDAMGIHEAACVITLMPWTHGTRGSVFGQLPVAPHRLYGEHSGGECFGSPNDNDAHAQHRCKRWVYRWHSRFNL